MTVVVPPQGFRHAVDLLLKNSIRRGHLDAEQLVRDLVALGADMKAPPEFAAWTIAEFERVLERPAPAALAQLGQALSAAPERRDLFLIHVPEDRLPLAAPLAVELVRRRVSVAFAGYEVESQAQLASAVARGLEVNRAGVLLQTTDFLRRSLAAPAEGPRMRILPHTIAPSHEAERICLWLSQIHTETGETIA